MNILRSLAACSTTTVGRLYSSSAPNGGIKNLFVRNIPWAATEQDLAQEFHQFGNVINCKIVTDRETGRSRGFGFIEMDGESAPKAIEALNGKEFFGRELQVK